MCPPGQLETPDDEVLCLMDVLEEVGDDVARRCYWDFGDWSDLWRETKHAPTGVNLQVGSPAGKAAGACKGPPGAWMPAAPVGSAAACMLEFAVCAFAHGWNMRSNAGSPEPPVGGAVCAPETNVSAMLSVSAHRHMLHAQGPAAPTPCQCPAFTLTCAGSHGRQR